jgi:hypothetical protein
MDTANDPTGQRRRHPSTTWWILALVVLVAGAVFFSLGRTQRDVTDTRPLNAPAVPVLRPDQIENTLESQNGWNSDLDRDLGTRTPATVEPVEDPDHDVPAGPDTREQTLE